MPEAAVASGRAWRAVAAMFALNGALFGIWASRVPAVAARHGLEPGALGLLLLMAAAGAILSFPLSGRFSDRIGAYRVSWLTGFVFVAGFAALALAPNVGLLALALFVFGAGHGSQDVAMNAWAGEVERAAGRPLMSSFHAMWSLGAGAGAGSGYLAAGWGASVALHFAVAGGLITGLCFHFARIGWASDRHETRASPFIAIPRGALFLVGLVAMASAIGEGGMADWSAIFLVRIAHAPEAQAALGYASYSVVMVAMRLAGDALTRRFGPVFMGRLAGLAAATGALIAVVLASFWTALIGFALMAVGYALIIPLAFSRAANDPVLKPGAAIAAVSSLGYGGILMGPPLLGFVAQASSVRFAFLVLAGLALMVTGLAGALRRDAAPGAAPAHGGA